MTVREALRSAVEGLSDEDSARVLGYLEAITEERDRTNGASAAVGEYDELANLVPKPGFAPGSPLWNFVGFIKTDGPTDMAENHDRYLAEAYGNLHEE